MEYIYPMFALVLLTFVIGILLGASRFTSVKNKQVDPRYYKLLVGDTPPENVIKLGRNFSNLLEVPILFYVLCTVMLVLQLNNVFMLTMAWVFVLTRVVHSFIHVTYNHPLHRFAVFLISNIVLLVMWIYLVTSISSI